METQRLRCQFSQFGTKLILFLFLYWQVLENHYKLSKIFRTKNEFQNYFFRLAPREIYSEGGSSSSLVSRNGIPCREAVSSISRKDIKKDFRIMIHE